MIKSKSQDNPEVIGVMLYTPDGIPIKTTVDNTTAAMVGTNFFDYVYHCLEVNNDFVKHKCMYNLSMRTWYPS